MVLSLQEHLIIFSTNRRVSRYPLETLGCVILRVHFESQVSNRSRSVFKSC